MKSRIFISSVQREFAKERKALASYIRQDAILGKFFEVFLFEEVPAQERKADGVYLSEVDECDIYLGIFGHAYGNVDSSGVSATEREYQRAAKKHKPRICFVDKSIGDTDPRQAAFLSRVNADVVRRGFVGYDDLRTAVYAALAKYLEDKGLINVLPFDCSNSANVQLKNLAISKMRQFVRDARIERKWNIPANATPVKILEALRLVDDNGRILNPAVLLFGKDPQRFFPASCVKCAWFLTDRVEKPMADHQIYTGDIFKMVDDATFFVMSHISNQIGPHDAADSAAATSRFELPEPAVREAIVNAVCHRDYSSAASVQVMLFKDRLEIWSPGPLPKGMTLAKMYKRHKSYPANPLLAYAMFLRKYVEQTGTGTGDIIARCREWGLPDPQWQVEDGEDFVMVMPRPQSSVKGSVRSSVKSVDKTVDWTVDKTVDWTVNKTVDGPTNERILKLLATNPRATQEELARVLGLSVRGIEYAIGTLKKAKRIRKVGGKRFGHWEVIG